MKTRMLIAFAGAAALIAGESANAEPTIVADVNTTNAFLVANNLQSATIRITGFNNGDVVSGFVGNAANPWNVTTGDGGAFFNFDTPDSLLTHIDWSGSQEYAAPSNDSSLNVLNPNIQWDSGLLGSLTAQPNSSLFGVLGGGGGGFGFYGDTNGDPNLTPVAWVSLSGVNATTTTNLRVMRITWAANTSATVSFVLAMSTPQPVNIPMSITLPAVPAPGGLALIGLAGMVGARRRR